jgi:hypothetical protein
MLLKKYFKTLVLGCCMHHILSEGHLMVCCNSGLGAYCSNMASIYVVETVTT